jgi:hypothetical protein
MKPFVGILFWLLLWLPVAKAQSWPVSAAPWRVRVEKVAETPWPVKVGVAQVWPGNLDPLKLQSYVVSTNGSVVGSRVLWAAAGEPANVLFDTSSGSDAYFIYLSPPPLPATPAWEPLAGVVVETRLKPPGPVDSWRQMQEFWKKAVTIQGRSVISQVYLGLNPHGPAREFLACYRGLLRVDETGEYALATVSGDASFLFLNGKPVAEWPGNHGPWEGRHGRYSGKVRLTAGTHALEYYHAVSGSEPLAEVAWRRPGKDRFEVVPARAFGAVAQFAAVGWENAPWNPTGVYAEWSPREQASAQGFNIVTMELRVPGVESNAVCQWTFDDNSTASGGTVEHVFARPGMRALKVEVRPGHTLATQFLVRPNWWQLEEWPAEGGVQQPRAARVAGRGPRLSRAVRDGAGRSRFVATTRDGMLEAGGRFHERAGRRVLCAGPALCGPERARICGGGTGLPLGAWVSRRGRIVAGASDAALGGGARAAAGTGG